MKVIVTKYLNVRVGKPRLNAPCYQYLAPGSELEVDGIIYPGDPYDGISTWLRDEANNYYWSGGVDEESLKILMTNMYPKWMVDLNIPKIWEVASGKGVGVAVVDTGIDMQNEQLHFDENNYYVFDQNLSLQDTYGHGTHCASLIAAQNSNGNFVGVAPNCNLFVCKISNTGSILESETVRYANAINWCADQDEIHIISISWGSFINTDPIIKEIQKSIDNAISKNKLVICAIGDASQFPDKGPLYPASLKDTIAVGSIPKGSLFPYVNEFLTIVSNGYQIPSYWLNSQLLEKSGTSQSNAIIAGICALIIERKNFNYTPLEIKQILVDITETKLFNNTELQVLNRDSLLSLFKD